MGNTEVLQVEGKWKGTWGLFYKEGDIPAPKQLKKMKRSVIEMLGGERLGGEYEFYFYVELGLNTRDEFHSKVEMFLAMTVEKS